MNLRGAHDDQAGRVYTMALGWPWKDRHNDPGRIHTMTLEGDTQRPRKGASIDPSEVNPGLIHMTTSGKV